MANQAIALQARAPQGNFLAPAIQQGAQLINMMSQQRAAERQAAIAQQTMEIQRAAEGRAARGEEIATRKANQDYVASRVAYFQNQLPSVKDDASWNNWLNQVSKEDPEYAGEMRRVSGGRYDPDYVDRVSMTAEAFINKRIATPMASLQIGADNKAFSAVVGGTNPSVTPLTVAPAPSATVSGVPARAAPATPAPSAAAPSAPAPAAGGMFQPISATGGQQQGENPATVALAAALTKAEGTKSIDAGTVEQIKTMIQPELVDRFIKTNGIQVSPGGGMRSAVYRPGEDAAPQMQMVQAYNRPGSQFQVAKDPMQSPMPGSAIVPLPRVAAEATVRREPPAEAEARAAASMRGGLKPPEVIEQEAYATRKGQVRAEKDTDFLEKYEGVKSRGQTALNAIDSMIGDLTVENGRLKAGKRPPHPGFETVVGFTLFPGARFIDGTDAAGFDAYLKQIEGQAFLQAFDTLKGGGAITQIEGEKATTALSRMKRSTNEVEFVKAAREFSDILRRGLEKSDARRARLLGGGGAAPAAAGQTPTPRGRKLEDVMKKYGG
jgi:hypothetical protein